VKYGNLGLNKITVDTKVTLANPKIYIGTKLVNAKLVKQGSSFTFHFENKIELKKGQQLKLNLS
jgi:hypothetical protein